jgi:hypothetical protein
MSKKKKKNFAKNLEFQNQNKKGFKMWLYWRREKIIQKVTNACRRNVNRNQKNCKHSNTFLICLLNEICEKLGIPKSKQKGF